MYKDGDNWKDYALNQSIIEKIVAYTPLGSTELADKYVGYADFEVKGGRDHTYTDINLKIRRQDSKNELLNTAFSSIVEGMTNFINETSTYLSAGSMRF